MPLKMPIKTALLYALSLCCITLTATAQDEEKQPVTFNIGDKAPPLQVRKWLKGTPVNQFEKGKVYVVELWATWCRPCNAAMPHLSSLARQYKDTVTFIGMDIMETPTTTLNKLQAFVDSIGERLDFSAAADDNGYVEKNWFIASGSAEQGIPKSFIINADGKLAWLGEPYEIDTVLRKVVNNTWDIKNAKDKYIYNRHLEEADHKVAKYLHRYDDDFLHMDFTGKPDSMLMAIDSIVKLEPGLKYAPLVANVTMAGLVKTNIPKAMEYGKALLENATYDDPATDAIIYTVQKYTGKSYIPVELYHLAAEAYRLKISLVPYPALFNMYKYYRDMADMYLQGNDKANAVTALEQAVVWLKRNN